MIYLVLVLFAAINSFFTVALVRAIGYAILGMTWTGKFYWKFDFFWPYQVPPNWLQIFEILLIAFLVKSLFNKFFNKHLKYWLVVGIFLLVHFLLIFIPAAYVKLVDRNALTPIYKEQSFDFSKEVLITDNIGQKTNLHISGNKVLWVQNMALSLSPKARNFTNGLTRDLLVFKFDESSGKGKTSNLTNGEGDVGATDVHIVDDKVFWTWDDGKYNKNIHYFHFDSGEKKILVSDIIRLYKVTSDFLFYHKNDNNLFNYDKFLYNFELANSEYVKEKMLSVVAFGDGEYACYEVERYEEGPRKTDLVRYNLVTNEKEVFFTGDSLEFEDVSISWCGEKYVVYNYKPRKGERGTKFLNIQTGEEVFDRPMMYYRAGMKLIGDDVYFSDGGSNSEKNNQIIYKYSLVDKNLEILYKRNAGIAYWDTDGKYLVFVEQGAVGVNNYDTGPLYLVPVGKNYQKIKR